MVSIKVVVLLGSSLIIFCLALMGALEWRSWVIFYFGLLTSGGLLTYGIYLANKQLAKQRADAAEVEAEVAENKAKCPRCDNQVVKDTICSTYSLPWNAPWPMPGSPEGGQ